MNVKSLTLYALFCSSLFMTACQNKEVPDEAVSATNGYGDVPVEFEVDELAPNFTLTDSNDSAVTLASFRNKQPVMLVFYRGNWCPFCVAQFDDMQTVFPKLAENNIQLIAISPDNIEENQKMAEKFEVPYIFLADVELQVIEQYGLRRDENLPHPAVVLINQEGEVVWYYAASDYKTRPSASQIQQVITRYFEF